MNTEQKENLIAAFKRRNIHCEFVQTRNDALLLAKSFIKEGESVSFSGSKTIHQCGIDKWLRCESEKFTLYDPYRAGINWDERRAINRKGMTADWILSGANAVTEGGEIVNLDGIGNRVAGISFGPKQVLIVAGQNKIVPDLEAAFKRVREIAAPQNSIRLKFGNPCEADGVCHDCTSPVRICRVWQIVEGQMDPNRLKLIIVEEELGL